MRNIRNAARRKDSGSSRIASSRLKREHRLHVLATYAAEPVIRGSLFDLPQDCFDYGNVARVLFIALGQAAIMRHSLVEVSAGCVGPLLVLIHDGLP